MKPLTKDQQTNIDRISAAVKKFTDEIRPITQGKAAIVFAVDLPDHRAVVNHLPEGSDPDMVAAAQILEQGAQAFLFKITGLQVNLRSQALPANEMDGDKFPVRVDVGPPQN